MTTSSYKFCDFVYKQKYEIFRYLLISIKKKKTVNFDKPKYNRFKFSEQGLYLTFYNFIA